MPRLLFITQLDYGSVYRYFLILYLYLSCNCTLPSSSHFLYRRQSIASIKWMDIWIGSVLNRIAMLLHQMIHEYKYGFIPHHTQPHHRHTHTFKYNNSIDRKCFLMIIFDVFYQKLCSQMLYAIHTHCMRMYVCFMWILHIIDDDYTWYCVWWQ